MPAPPPAEAEPGVFPAWLRLLASDVRENPHRMTLLTEAEAAALDELVKGMTIHDDDVLADDVTL
jgi:hypothetical protein